MDHTTDEAFWRAVRASYPEQRPLLNLNNAAVSPPPLRVEQAVIDAFRLINHNPDTTMWYELDAAIPRMKVDLARLADCYPSVKAYAQAITSRTRALQVTFMSHWTGRVLPNQRLCDLASSTM
jgi:selenocysteine lyase/cysteine desulfurase